VLLSQENQVEQHLYPETHFVAEAMTHAFSETNKEVYAQVSDVRFSGSTCTSLMVLGRKVYVANVGDSRSILVKGNNQEVTQVIQLSRDHKPDDELEAAHIL